ncbi:MAG: hypothetical protein LBF86_02035 [Helicobacteraceae bacterium]|jgi:predicted phage terminase large subunit-like protein|nr:hypothetical protein [Helicobacteraceae bacterium]
MSKISVSSMLAERELARRNFLEFMRYSFRYIYAREFKHNWHHGYLAEVFSAVERGEINRVLLNMPPSYGKTEQAARQFISWALGRNPQRKFIYATYGADLSEQVSVQTRNIVAHSAYAAVFPRLKLSREQNQKHYWTTSAGGGMYVTGTGGAITGFHGDYLIVDDLLKAIDARSRAARDEAWDYYRESIISRLQDKKRGAIIVIMQRLHKEDPAGRLLADEAGGEFLHICLRGIEDEPKRYEFGGFIYERAADEPLFEALEGIKELERAKKEMGVSGFSAQYQQDPETIEAGFFTDDMMNQSAALGDLPPLNTLIMVDPAMSLKAESDDRAIVVEGWGTKNDAELIVLLDCWAGKWTIDEFVERIIDAIERHPSARTYIEGAGGGHALAQLLPAALAKRNAKRREHNLAPLFSNYEVYPTDNKITKEQKISVLQPYFNNSQIVFLRSANGVDDFKKEARAWSPDKKHNRDNRLDAFASGWRFATPKKQKRYVETGRIRAREGGSYAWRF